MQERCHFDSHCEGELYKVIDQKLDKMCDIMMGMSSWLEILAKSAQTMAGRFSEAQNEECQQCTCRSERPQSAKRDIHQQPNHQPGYTLTPVKIPKPLPKDDGHIVVDVEHGVEQKDLLMDIANHDRGNKRMKLNVQTTKIHVVLDSLSVFFGQR